MDSGLPEARLVYRTGTVALEGGVGTLRLSPAYRFLDRAGAKYLLEDAWGNPPGAADDVLGMIIPTNVSPLDEAGWGVVVSFDDVGYIDDKDAATINFADLLLKMQKDAARSNEERRTLGTATVELIGWAEQPTYSAQSHTVYWAKELAFSDNPDHTLNYFVRVLGRRGVLELNAVGSMTQLQQIREDMQAVLPLVSFDEGHRYADYEAGQDKAAAYGVAGLVAGAAAVKGGLLKGLLVGLLAAKKLLIAVGIAILAAIRGFLGRTSNTKAE
jgi:uncharacterized membrane-anchored protein